MFKFNMKLKLFSKARISALTTASVASPRTTAGDQSIGCLLQRVRFLSVALLIWLCLSAWRVLAFSLFDHNFNADCNASGANLLFSDVLTNPDDHWSWDLNTIRYRFDASFIAKFPDPKIANQVRMALDEWSNADTVNCGTRDDYLRTPLSGPPNQFIDIRTTTLHEVGHVLGFAHPNQGFAAGVNFRPPAGTCLPPPPVSGQPNTTREVMHAFA